MALRSNRATEGWLGLDRARGWDDFVEAMRLVEAPQLNVVYADVEGNIGYWVTGTVPVRARGTGMVPAPGWTGEYEWVGEVPFEEMPHALNPAQGYVVTCNHRIVADDYPHYLGEVWMNGYRARRIVDVLEAKDRLSVEDLAALHVDVHSIPGLELAAHLAQLSSPDPDVQAAIDLLRDWDGQLAPESVGATLYEVTLYHLWHNVLSDALDEDLLYRLLGEGVHPLLYSCNEYHGHVTVALLRMLDDPDSAWVQDAGGKEALLLRSVEEAVSWLKGALGDDMELARWQWGQLHQVVFPHGLGVQPPLDRVFNLGPHPMGGDTDTVCQTAFMARDPYGVNSWAPSHRQVITLGDMAQSSIIHAPGQSGQLGSDHYDDLIEPWLRGDYVPMLWTRAQVEQAARARLQVEPVEGAAFSPAPSAFDVASLPDFSDEDEGT
jgi:penicillin amidase